MGTTWVDLHMVVTQDHMDHTVVIQECTVDPTVDQVPRYHTVVLKDLTDSTGDRMDRDHMGVPRVLTVDHLVPMANLGRTDRTGHTLVITVRTQVPQDLTDLDHMGDRPDHMVIRVIMEDPPQVHPTVLMAPRAHPQDLG